MDPKDSDITVTSATQTEAAVRERHDPKPADPTPPPAEPEKAAAPAADPEAAELEKELDKLEPPSKPNETPDERKERRSRAEQRIAKLTGRAKGAEEALSKEKQRADAAERELQRLRSQAQSPAPAPAVPPTSAEKPADGAAPASAKPDDAPKFEFPSWDEYQEAHPEAEYHQYTDARTDARYAWNTRVEAENAARESAAKARAEKQQAARTATDELRAQHPDFDEAIRSFEIPGLETDPTDGRILSAPPTYNVVRDLLEDAGKDKPAILLYLAKHHNDATALFESSNMPALLMEWGFITRSARAYVSQLSTPKVDEPAVPARPPSKPTSDAPAPVEPVKGSAITHRSLQALAADDEDADAYIARRQAERKAAGLR